MTKWDDYIPIFGVGLIVVPLALLLGYFFWINNSSDTKEIRAVLFASKSYDIRSVEVKWIEFADNTPASSRQAEALTFSDPKSVADIVDALATATEASPPHERKSWTALLQVTHAKRTVDVLVVGYDSFGTTLQLNSNGKQGWNLGTYNCTQLGPVLERLVGRPFKAVEKVSE